MARVRPGQAVVRKIQKKLLNVISSSPCARSGKSQKNIYTNTHTLTNSLARSHTVSLLTHNSQTQSESDTKKKYLSLSFVHFILYFFSYIFSYIFRIWFSLFCVLFGLSHSLAANNLTQTTHTNIHIHTRIQHTQRHIALNTTLTMCRRFRPGHSVFQSLVFVVPLLKCGLYVVSLFIIRFFSLSERCAPHSHSDRPTDHAHTHTHSYLIHNNNNNKNTYMHNAQRSRRCHTHTKIYV